MYLPIEHRVVRCGSGDLPIRVCLPGGGFVVIRRGGSHPILGPVDEITEAGGAPLTVCGRINWSQPERIPPVWEPAKLPPGAGSSILNAISEAAPGPLRYRGPYPTAALFGSLAASFRTESTESEFTAESERAAVSGREVSPPCDFVPAPFVDVTYGPVCARLRGGSLEAITVFGARFLRSAEVGRRLIASPAGFDAVLELGGEVYAAVASVDAKGVPRRAPEPPRPIDSPMCGAPIPDVISAAIWQALLAEAKPLVRSALERASRRVSISRIIWDDCGLSPCMLRMGEGETIALHAGYGGASKGGAALLAELTAVVRPVAYRLAARYADASALSEHGN